MIANAAVIVWLWLHNGGITKVHSTADLLTSIGRITGLIGTYLALLQILLLARLPWLERLSGFDRLTLWHRRNGRVCLSLLLVHTVLITIGYAMTDQISVAHEVSTLWNTYPEIVPATIGTIILLAVVASSLVIVRRRLPYEAWYFVHLSVYVGIVLAYLHQIPTGNELSADHLAADYWIGLYVATLVLLLVFRVALPVLQGAWYGLRVAEVRVEAPGIVSLRMTGRHLDRLNARAGQFFIWRFLTRGRWWQPHPFSLSAAPDGRSLRITAKAIGNFTRAMAEIKPGTAVLAEGPFGTFTDDVRRQESGVMIAGGIGITPIRALLEEMPRASGELSLIYRVMREDDLVFRDEIEGLARERGVSVHFVVGDHRHPDGDRLLSPDHLRELVPDIVGRDVYVCGPPGLVDVIQTSLRRAEVPRRQIHTERFAF